MLCKMYVLKFFRKKDGPLTPRDSKCAFGPIPESISILGLPMDPALSIISFLAFTVYFLPKRSYSTPYA